VLGKMSPVHINPSYFFKIYFNIILLYLGLQSGLVPSDFLPKFYIYFFSPTCVQNAHLILLDLIILTILGAQIMKLIMHLEKCSEWKNKCFCWRSIYLNLKNCRFCNNLITVEEN
jgi:hypothetical protein